MGGKIRVRIRNGDLQDRRLGVRRGAVRGTGSEVGAEPEGIGWEPTGEKRAGENSWPEDFGDGRELGVMLSSQEKGAKLSHPHLQWAPRN